MHEPNITAAEMKTCDRCMGSGYQGHPDDPAGECMKCDGQGGVPNTTDLKPCPFCGSDPEYKTRNVLFPEMEAVGCIMPLCAVMPETAWNRTREDAARQWNTRA